jgi:pyruvate/2-oxoglutarate dehydrogenase complex dihydrolipoamide dehydrogenase (E3) component
MKYDYHIIVIGAGSAGLVAASSAAQIGAKAALIESDKMGGDCLNTGCVPSKAFLKAAHMAYDIRQSSIFGLDSEIKKVDLSKVMKRVHAVIAEIAPNDSKERYEGLGVDVFKGKAILINPHTVLINHRKITGKSIVIATGSRPSIPRIKGLDTVSYLTNETIFELKTLPNHLIVLGCGPIGLELGQGFRYLGSSVTMIGRSGGIFTKDDPEVSPIMMDRFKQDGIDLRLSSKIIEIKRSDEDIIIIIEQQDQKIEIKGDQLLIALGRKASTENLGIEAIGVKVNEKGFILTNKKMQTSVKNIYACGDVTGPYLFTHMASHQASIAVQNSIFRLGRKVNYSIVPWTTYTKPEVAHVGYTEAMAKEEGIFGEFIHVPLSEIDRAKTENDTHGFIKLILNKKNRLIGATLVGDKAGEMIPIASLAIKKHLKASVFLSFIYSYPTEAEIFLFAALKKVKASFKDWQKKLIQILFLR